MKGEAAAAASAVLFSLAGRLDKPEQANCLLGMTSAFARTSRMDPNDEHDFRVQLNSATIEQQRAGNCAKLHIQWGFNLNFGTHANLIFIYYTFIAVQRWMGKE